VGVVELEAAAALYTGATLEQVGPFAIVDRLVELWLARGLPVSATNESHALDRYWRGRGDHLSDDERRAVYAGVFGEPFDDLWSRLMVALASEDDAVAHRADAVRAHLDARVDEQVLRATPLLYGQLRAALDVLSDGEILETHGARDMWQLIDQRGRLDLATEPEVARVRTMAASGAQIIAWLASSDAADAASAADADAVEAAQSWLAVAAPPG
jgi:hypothetical protein